MNVKLLLSKISQIEKLIIKDGYLILLLILFYTSPKCQITVSGSVKSSKFEIIESCNVLLLEKGDSSIVDFSFTDSSGIFELSTDSMEINNLVLFFSSLGYLNKYTDLSAVENYVNIEVILYPDGQFLDEIIINEKQYAKQNGDTLIYYLDNFRDSTEHTIGQLLNKLPGIEVNHKGDIKVMAQAIYNVTIDGDDLTGKRYQLISNSLSAKAIKRAKIIYNYNENKLLNDIFESNSVSLNLVTDEQYRSQWNASINLGGSLTNYDIQFSPIGLFNKLKIIGDVNVNNIGKGLFGRSDFDHSFIAPLFISEKIDDRTNPRYSNFERDISRFNDKRSLNTSILYKINSHSKLRINYDLGLERFSTKSSTDILLTNDQILRRDIFSSTSEIHQYAVAAKWENHMNEKSYIDIFFQSSNHKYGHNDMSTTFASNDVNKKSENLFRITYIYKPLRRKLLMTDIRFSQNNSSSTYVNRFGASYIRLLEAETDSIHQQYFTPYQDFQFSQTFLHRFDSSILHIAAGIKGRWIRQSIDVIYPVDLPIEILNQTYQEYYTLFKYDWTYIKNLKIGFSLYNQAYL